MKLKKSQKNERKKEGIKEKEIMQNENKISKKWKKRMNIKQWSRNKERMKTKLKFWVVKERRQTQTKRRKKGKE